MMKLELYLDHSRLYYTGSVIFFFQADYYDISNNSYNLIMQFYQIL